MTMADELPLRSRERRYGKRGRIDSRRARYWLRKQTNRKRGGSVRAWKP